MSVFRAISRPLRMAAAVALSLIPLPVSGTSATPGAGTPAGPVIPVADAPTESSSLDTARLARRIEQILARPGVRRAHWGIEVMDPATGRSLYRHNAERLFVPASALKIVVAAAAEHYLDPGFRYRTTLFATGPMNDGVLEGDLVIQGTGDPTISARYFPSRTAVLEMLADSLAARGIRRIAGAIVADESHWPAERYRPDWSSYDILWWYGAPTGPLGLNDNSIDFRVLPGELGRPANITWQPQTRFFHFRNGTITVPAGREKTLDFDRVPGTDTIFAYGEIPLDAAARTESFAVDDPARYLATVFREVLERKGIAVGAPELRFVRPPGFPAPLAAPGGSGRAGAYPFTLVEYSSPPLGRIIGPVLLRSQNWFAEQLVRTIGKEVAGEGSWKAGLELERRFLVDVVGLDSSSFHLADASGLANENLISPHALARLLRYVHGRPRAAVWESMPVSGEQVGSLRNRLLDLRGRVRAKTGGIQHVESLAGFVRTDAGRDLIFVIIANNTGQTEARVESAINDIVRAVATTP